MATAPAGPRLTLDDFRPGSLRGVEGFFRVGQTRSGKWWFLDPNETPWWCRAATKVEPLRPLSENGSAAAIDAPESADEWRSRSPVDESERRLIAWDFNAIGAGSAEVCQQWSLPFQVVVDFKRYTGLGFRIGAASLPDVFDPRWVEACHRRARECCGRYLTNRRLVGYFTDDDLGWAQPREQTKTAGPSKPALLQVCLSLEPSFAVYHAAWEFVLAPHGGDLAVLARAWNVELPNRGALRHQTEDGVVLQTPGYMDDQRRFSREFARRYFSVTADAIRRQDPNHLILGCRLDASISDEVLQECTSPHVDVVSLKHEGRAAPSAAGGYTFQETGCPLLVEDFCWSGSEFTERRTDDETEGLSALERMHRRGRAVLESIIRDPAVVGYSWNRWIGGEPKTAPPFSCGLNYTSGIAAREHVDPLAAIHAAAEIRRARD